MKTYIAFVKETTGYSILALESYSQLDAYIELKDKGFQLNLQNVKLSSVHIDNLNCLKLKTYHK